MWIGSNGTARQISSLKDIQIVQNLSERCLELYMNQGEVASTLLDRAKKIEPGFTQLVWQKLEDFEAYCLRLAVKDQVMGYNELLYRHWQLTQNIISSIPSMSISNGSHDIPRPSQLMQQINPSMSSSNVPLKTQSIWFLLSALASIWIFVVFRRGANKNACASCNYQRRRCNKDCLMAPYFPGDKPEMFRAVHNLFGVKNVMNKIKATPDDRKEDAVKSIIYESLIRERLPVRGCQGYIDQLEHHVIFHQHELGLVRARLALYRGQSDQGHAGATAFGFSPRYTSEHMVPAVNHAAGSSLQNALSNGGGSSLVPTVHSTVGMSVHPVQSSNMSSTQGLNGSMMRSETGYSVGSQYMFSPDVNVVGEHPPVDTMPHQDLREPFLGSDRSELAAEFPQTLSVSGLAADAAQSSENYSRPNLQKVTDKENVVNSQERENQGANADKPEDEEENKKKKKTR